MGSIHTYTLFYVTRESPLNVVILNGKPKRVVRQIAIGI